MSNRSWFIFFQEDGGISEVDGPTQGNVLYSQRSIYLPGEVPPEVASLNQDLPSEPIIFSFGGLSPEAKDGYLESSQRIRTFIPGCPSGFFSPNFSFVACQPCPRGSYSLTPASTACEQCPKDVTTVYSGSTTFEACNVCQDDACSSHATCQVNDQFLPQCECHFGFTGERCETNLLGIVLGSISALFLIALIIFYVLKEYRRRLNRSLW